MSKNTIRLTETDLTYMIKESARAIVAEASRGNKEQLLTDLYNYLAQEPTEDIYDVVNSRKRLNTTRKAYNYFTPKEIVHNAWAIHFTNLEAYENINNVGFRLGQTNLDKLAYRDDDYVPKNGGWCFALPIDNEYLGEDCGYGDCGFIIKTDGVRAYHEGDKDDEIIFKGNMVKKKIPFMFEDDTQEWNLTGWEGPAKGEPMPKGAYYNKDFGCVLFKNFKSMISFAIKNL